MSIAMTTIPNANKIKSIRDLLLIKSDQDEIRLILRDELSINLDDVVKMNKAHTYVLDDLLHLLDKSDRLDEFISALMRRKKNLTEVLGRILGNIPAPSRQVTKEEFHSLAKEIRDRYELFEYVKASKHLHDILHDLSGLLKRLEEEATTRSRDGVSIPDLTADSLIDWAQEAEIWAAKSEFPNDQPLSVWVPRLTSALGDFLGEDASKHRRALETIAGTPGRYLREAPQGRWKRTPVSGWRENRIKESELIDVEMNESGSVSVVRCKMADGDDTETTTEKAYVCPTDLAQGNGRPRSALLRNRF